jgi:gliding motility-associated-like protein
MQVRFGKMEETLPASWTEDEIGKNEITVGYKKIKNNIYGFETANAISDKTVIIDPVPVRLWGTYYGGENLEFSSSVFVKDSFVYWAGTTYSNNNIASSGAHQNYYNAGWDYDSFFTKLNSDGTRVWGTYYGGGYADRINQIRVSNNDNVYIGGETLSKTNITTFGSHQQNAGDPDWNGYDGFLVKFDNNGIRQWGTYYGDLNDERINSLIIDSNEKIYISGETRSDKNIATNGSYQPNYTNQGQYPYDGFIAKFNSNGVREWGTYCGGNNRDAILDSKLDSNGDLIFLGITNSTSGIATPNSYQEMNNGLDGFLVKFDTNGNRIWGTYFGGNSDDLFFNLGIDASDNLYCFGQTYSTINISTTGVFQEIYKSNQLNHSGCIFKLNPNGFKTWGSYFFPETLGGSVSKTGNVYFTGRVENGFDATPNSYQDQPISSNSGTDSYLVKLNTNGQREWATYFGGEMADNAYITEVGDNSNIYLAGITNSFTSIATPNTYQPNRYPDTNFYTFNGGDAFLVKFKDCLSSTTATSNSPICVGGTLELKASGGTDYAWTGPNGFTSTLQNPTISNATAQNSGQYSCSITGTGGCDDTKTIDVIVRDVESPIPNIVSLPILNGDCNTVITTIPLATDNCAGTITATTLSPLTYGLPGTYNVIWNYNDGNGNTSTQNQTITINNQPLPTSTSTQTFCIQQNATLSSITITGQNIKWYDALTNGTLLSDTTPLQNGFTYYASQTINGCESERIPVLINIQNTPAPTGNANQTFCSSQNPTLETIEISGNEIKWYNSAGVLLSNSTPLQDGLIYYASQTMGGCENPDKLAITISLINTLPASNYEELFCDDLNDGSEKVNLSDYDSKLISNTLGYTFSYYSTFLGAENKLATNQINNFSNHYLALGDNKIYVRINSNTPCYAIIELKLTLVSKPIIIIPDVVPICENNSIIIDAGSGFDTYLWSNGATTPSISVSNPGNFSVTVTNNYSTISCSSTKNFEVKKSNIATITATETKDWTDNENIITVFASGEGDFEYSIDGIHFQDSNQFSALYSGEYTIHVRDKNGCGTATDIVYLLMYPKYFTPNGDGFNDTWNIKFSDLETNLTVKIFDRYGKLLKVLIQNGAWNGTMNEHELPSDDYWFVVTRTDGKEYKGHFSLKR